MLVSSLVISFLAVVFSVWTYFALFRVRNSKKAVQYAVTLKQNQGAFIGLCIEKRRDTWTFVDVRVQPVNHGGPVEHVEHTLHVPYRNILYYQEIANVAE